MSGITGLHHVTAIAGDAQENVDFYARVLGMRLVKRSVNQDSPGTYHLFYADADGTPGTDLTFFPWPELKRAQEGHGLTMECALAIPSGSLSYWTSRLAEHGVATEPVETRRGGQVLPFRDPHGLPLSLAETSDAREFAAWANGPVPVEHQVRGLHAVRLWERDVAATAAFLTAVLGFTALDVQEGWTGFATQGHEGGLSGRLIELRQAKAGRGQWGTGGIHHVAWRVTDEDAELEMRARVQAANRRPTEVIDRFWFKAVYFLEPGGVLFELATDGPGFAVDEDPAHLGESLVLPPWLEAQRAEIERALPEIRG